LQEFWPAHPCDSLLQALCPLHEFPPTHLTELPADGLSAARMGVARNIIATDVASIVPVIAAFFILTLLDAFGFMQQLAAISVWRAPSALCSKIRVIQTNLIVHFIDCAEKSRFLGTYFLS
jgi:hypothetical protein